MATTKKTYTFAVYLTCDEPDDDGNGFDAREVEGLLSRTLRHYNAALNLERRAVAVDYELMSVEDGERK